MNGKPLDIVTVSRVSQEDADKPCTSIVEYEPDVNDCDDFAIHLWSKVKKDYPLLSFGFVLSSGHAFNIFIDNNLEIWIVEPQTDELISLDNAKKKDLYKNFKLIIM